MENTGPINILIPSRNVSHCKWIHVSYIFIPLCLYIRSAVCIASVSLCIWPYLVWYFTYLSNYYITVSGWCNYCSNYMIHRTTGKVLLLKDIHNLQAIRSTNVSATSLRYWVNMLQATLMMMSDCWSMTLAPCAKYSSRLQLWKKLPRSCDVRLDLLDKQLWDASVCFCRAGWAQSWAACRSMSVSSSQMWVMLQMFANANPNIAQMHWQVASP